jgi:hypothetical protein
MRPGSGPPDAATSEMVTALVRLREALAGVALPLDVPGAEEHRNMRQEMIDQLEDYVLPRLIQIDAPLLAVVGGSTGAGKSTLVNSLVGHRVTEPGLLRPTTRSPVLVHNPADVDWFDKERILPGLARTTRTTGDPGALQLVSADTVPEGLAVLDAPDIDSVEQANRTLAAELLAAADLWLFVTSAARYADQVPWEFLKAAAERSTAVAIVLDRTAPEAVEEVSGHLARMLTARGLRDSPLFTVTEGTVDDDGLLPAGHVAEIRGWLDALAADAGARAAVVKQTLDGAVRSLSSAPMPRRSRRSTRPPRTGRSCAARCSPGGRSSSAPGSCCAASRPRWAGCGTGWSAGSRERRRVPNASPWRSSPASRR